MHLILAYYFTKPIQKELFHKFRDKIMGKGQSLEIYRGYIIIYTQGESWKTYSIKRYYLDG